MIGLVEDVTEAHLAEERMAAHLALQDVVLQVAERFVNIDTSEVDRALATCGGVRRDGWSDR